MIRVAILADTHGQLDPRIDALVRGCDIAVHGGDIGNAGILARLQPVSGRVYAVRGNNDVPRKWPEHERGLLETCRSRRPSSCPEAAWSSCTDTKQPRPDATCACVANIRWPAPSSTVTATG